MKKLLLIFLILHTPSIFPQVMPYYHYSPKDGLPSSNVMDILQDHEGLIWFATANGISHFDGLNFINYGVSDGLNSNMITSIIEGHDGEIYIGNYEKGINIYKGGKISKFPIAPGKDFQISYLLLNKNKVYAYGQFEAYFFEESEDKFKTDTNIILSNDKIYNNLNKLKRLADNSVIALTNYGFYKFENEKFTKLQIKGFNDEVLYCLTQDANNILYAGGKNKIYIIKDFCVIDEIKVDLFSDVDVFRILIDRRGNLWFSIIGHGFYLIPAGSNKIIDIGKKLNLQNTQVNKFFEDNEGNIWIGTFDKGIFCFNNMYLTNYMEEDGLSNSNVQCIKTDGLGRTYIGTFNGLNILENDEIKKIYSNFKVNFTDYISEIHLIENKVFLCGSFGNNNIYTHFRGYRNIDYIFFTASSFCKTYDNNYLIGDWGNDIFGQEKFDAGPYNPSDTIFVIGDNGKYNRINKIFEDSKKRLWIGTSLGLARISGNDKKIFDDDEVLNNKIESVIEDRNNNIWIAGEKGIACISPANDSIKSYTKLMGYELSSSTSLAVDSKNQIWVGNKNGLFIINKNSIKHLNMLVGLPSNEVLSLYYDSLKNNMWIGSSSGLSRLDMNIFDTYSHHQLTIKVNNFTVNDQLYSIDYLPALKYYQNNIKVHFTAINFSSPGSVKYSYKLNDHEWQDLKTNYINFPELAPDSYILSIRAKRMNEEWSSPFILHFEITPPFYRKMWVEGASAVLFSFFVILAARKKLKNSRNKYKEKLELADRMNELKHQAVAAMMNPHFIFNCLSSVQYLVNLNKQCEANDYISLMARLVRMNLDTASKAFISIEEELMRLKLYMSIEKLRLDGKFTYEVSVDKEIQSELVLIPNMIIQPFVENSIWHGISPLENNGIIQVNIGFEDVVIKEEKYKFLLIRIIDNGIGVSNSHSNKKEGHTSRAIKIISERLIILSRKMELPAPIVINDLGVRSESSSGTEVILSLPPELYRINN